MAQVCVNLQLESAAVSPQQWIEAPALINNLKAMMKLETCAQMQMQSQQNTLHNIMKMQCL